MKSVLSKVVVRDFIEKNGESKIGDRRCNFNGIVTGSFGQEKNGSSCVDKLFQSSAAPRHESTTKLSW